MKLKDLACFAVAVLALTASAAAQSGCTDSPENPTIILALVGSAGGAVVALRARLGRRR